MVVSTLRRSVVKLCVVNQNKKLPASTTCRGESTLSYMGTINRLLWEHFISTETIYLLKANKMKIREKYILVGKNALPMATNHLRWQHAVL